MRVLYFTYDGILEPLGQSQVFSYLSKLAKQHMVYLISFEKKSDLKNKAIFEAMRLKMKNENIAWYPLTYHKHFSIISTTMDIFIGMILGSWIFFTKKIEILHARGYVVAVICLLIKKFTSAGFIFDMRGFWVDERVDGGLWHKDSWIYKIGKWFEKKFIVNADHIISLTDAGVNEIMNFNYIDRDKIKFSVIPTCTNLELFKHHNQNKSGLTVGYVGSVGVWYEFDAVIKAFQAIFLTNPSVNFLIVNRGDHKYIKERFIASNIPVDHYTITSSTYENMPYLINKMNMAIFFIKPLFSKKASAPTRLGEFLGCGIPCLSNEGIGDMTRLLEENKVGVAIKDFSSESIKVGVNRLILLAEDKEIQDRARNTSKKYFSLESGVEAYNSIYQSFRQ